MSTTMAEAPVTAQPRPCYNYYLLGKCKTSRKRCRNEHHMSKAEFTAAVTPAQLHAQLALRGLSPDVYFQMDKTKLLYCLTTLINPKTAKAAQAKSQNTSAGSNKRPAAAAPQSAALKSFHKRRTTIFSKFAEGVQIPDDESWYSITPEAVAKDIARLCGCKNGLVLDGFSGVGGNTIQFALHGASHVLSVEMDSVRAGCCLGNCKVYGVQSRVEVVCGDLLKVLPRVKPTMVFLSPAWMPWVRLAAVSGCIARLNILDGRGGPSYKDHQTFVPDQLTMKAIDASLKVCASAAIYLPRQTDQQFVLQAVSPLPCEFVVHKSHTEPKHVIAVTAFVGEVCTRVQQLYCKHCELICTSPAQLAQHLSGKQHGEQLQSNKE